MTASLRNGQDFEGISLGYFPNTVARFELRQDGRVTPYEGRLGDIPALQGAQVRNGLLVILHETEPASVKYKTWEKFQAFTDEKELGDLRSRHLARGLPLTDFFESYTRHAKSLVAVGSARGADAAAGMETEFVALNNPYADPPGEGMRVRLLYRDAPRAEVPVEVFARAPDGTVTRSVLRTDARGEALIPVASGHDYLLNAVVLRPLEGRREVWESLWASLTFHVP
ncbi:DUF4198 domain-containing protein [Cribrihabitans marinus]|uniref:DUF4198 domain-containing protein n=1 Tax=Cribrihabitans marinus TaxID=1227549 RepID=UPI001E5765AC